MCFNSKSLLCIIAFSFALLFLSGCLDKEPKNFFSDFPDRTTDEYRIEAAREHINKLRFDQAIQTLSIVTERSPANADARYLMSTAYAGRAGLRIADLVSDLINEDGGNLGILHRFALYWDQANLEDIEDMLEATIHFQGISDIASQRSGRMNFYGLFLYYSYIGIILNYAGLDEDSELRPNFRACHRVVDFNAARTGLSNRMVDEIQKTMARLIAIFSAITVSDDLAELLSDDNFPAGLAKEPICHSSQSDPLCLAVRSLINIGPSGGGMGFGTGEGTCVSVTP